MNNFLTRRKFFCALVAAVIAAGMPLPIGFPRELKWTAAGPGKIIFDAPSFIWYADYYNVISKVD